MRQARRLLWFASSTILLCALLGGAYGARVDATTDEADDSDVKANFSQFSRALNVIEQNYSETVDSDQVIFGPPGTGLGAIPGMLRTLDPHSNFLDPRTYQQFREDQEARYYGVGMSIQMRPGPMGKMVTIVGEPFPGSPAMRAGLRSGDIIIKVDGRSVENLNYTQVASLLKGPRGTMVQVSVERAGADQPINFTLTRAEISPKSVDAAYVLRSGVGYIHIMTFNESTNEALTEALNKLNVKSLQGLILDLRNNPGGLLQQAVDVGDHFLQKNQLIVYHSGRRSQEKRWYASDGDGGYEYPMVVLINHQTASAAEIVTGALQDHDRALVIGEPSFGKGLVQSEFPLSEKTLLLLTTARYYTPSGRLIQRNYSNASLYDYYYRYEESAGQKSEVRLTDGGREVYGGGGITPDVHFQEPKYTPAQETLLQHGAFFNFAHAYVNRHKSVPRDFQVTDDVLREFKDFLASGNIQVTDAEMAENLEYVKTQIRIEIVRLVSGPSEADRLERESDPLIQEAMKDLPRAAELLANAKKYIASRTQNHALNRP